MSRSDKPVLRHQKQQWEVLKVTRDKTKPNIDTPPFYNEAIGKEGKEKKKHNVYF